MNSLKYALILGVAALAAPSAKAATVDFQFGNGTQTGPAAIGATDDIWNAGNVTNGGPFLVKDVTGKATSVSVSWTSGDAWAATKTGIYTDTGSTAMDSTTSELMRSFLSSYAYSGTATNLSLTLTGLDHNQAYSLVLYAAGDQVNEGSTFTVTGNAIFTGSTTALNRKISAGAGVAYVTIPVVSSSTGTLKITAAKNGYGFAVLNGFQLVEETATFVTTTTATTSTTSTSSAETAAVVASAPATTAATTTTTSSAETAAVIAPTPATTTASATTTALVTSTTQASTKLPTTAAITTPATPTTSAVSSTALTPLIWGVCGHPTWSDYASWVPANFTTQMNDLKTVGASYYRISFEGSEYPSILASFVPPAKAAGISILPILPLSVAPASSALTNYNNNYATGYNWATYAISKGYAIPTWELGNEVENDGYVNVVYDGTHTTDFPDAQAGGFVAIANAFNGAYQGIKDAYAAGRTNKTTTITPEVLIGMCYRHWGLLSKIQAYDNGVLPCDAITWHWYGPNYGGFNTVISDTKSAANGRTPAQCLGDFKSKTNPSQPMDIWITETNRSQNITGGLLNGSVASNATPTTSQDWPAEATAIQNNIDSFKPVASVKAIFVYELYDETQADSASTAYLASEGYFGLITGLNGTKKNAFYTYQTEIKAGR